ncbi:MAG: CDP-alcohol phosphatidyltransferase family protein [Ignavibacteriota bacterium]|nr:CDP-alcohol phosphatidyltransferase family protein [Ignavibacteriota bacterium]
MSWYSEYKSSLKGYDVEELLDIFFYRPMSFLFVKLIYSTDITPNQISIVSMLFGILTGVMFGFGTHQFFVFGAIALLISNVLDCADGQLARLKKNGTGIGRIIDGFIDYITGLSIYVGIGIGLSIATGDYLYVWVITAIGGFSRVLQNMMFDNFRNRYLANVYDKGSNLDKEIEEYSRLKRIIDKTKGRYVEKFLVNIYIKYASVQNKTAKDEKMNVSSEVYKNKNIMLLRAWSWIGSTTHLTAVMIACVLNRVDLYLWVTFTLGNLLLISFYIIQKKVLNDLSK